MTASARSETICRVNVITNHVGYLTNGAKKFVVESNVDQLRPEFHVRSATQTRESARVFQGRLTEVSGDFGSYHVGDFSEFRTPGTYVIDAETDTPKCATSSELFSIEHDIYQSVREAGLNCFALQRCGPSTTGYNAPCHLDDGVRADSGEPMDLVGGWHDASDLLKWSGPTLVGMFGLLNIAERSGERQLMARVLEEVRWGNLYFLKLQAPEGYFYKHGIGGDAPEEGNHWTDNIRGTADDRRVVVHEADPAHDHGFIAAQAHLARLYRDWDAAYAKVCLEAALKCYRWVSKKESAAYDDYGTGCYAGLMLFHATGEREYLDYAARMADSLVGLQETGGGTDELRGYFYENASRQHGVPYEYNDRHFLTLATIGFCKLIEEAKGTLETARWEQALARHCNEYLHLMSERNAFGIVPYQVKLPETLVPGSRAYRGVSYRYFMSHLNGDWWSGNNTVLAGTGIVLCHAARILGERRHRDLGQRMLDWILGLNPFDVCMMRGVGHKHPPEYVDTGFIPRTPKITGSVMNGICGDGEDRPALQPGSWHSAEIWTPPLAQTIWLASELRYRD